jgi:ABC-type polysaccharide/polyol phosphate transport system ATPase subunit
MTLILVSHSSEQVSKFCDQYVRLDQGRVVEEGRIDKNTPTPSITAIPATA